MKLELKLTVIWVSCYRIWTRKFKLLGICKKRFLIRDISKSNFLTRQQLENLLMKLITMKKSKSIILQNQALVKFQIQ